MELVDTHCHLNDPNLALPVPDAMTNAHKAGVVQLIVPGMNWPTSERAVALAHDFPNVFAAVGIHPHNVLQRGEGGVSDRVLGELRSLAESTGKKHDVRSMKYGTNDQMLSSPRTPYSLLRTPPVVAIGEIGIDYHHYDRDETGAKQREAFAAQLQLAVELGLPAIVHGREAYPDVLDVIRAHPGSRGALHSFEASDEVARAAFDAGWLISLTALITYSTYDWLRDVVKQLPLDRLMLETDSPYLPPQSQRTKRESRGTGGSGTSSDGGPKGLLRGGGAADAARVVIGARGRNNQPAYLLETAQMLASLKGLGLDEVARVTTHTARAFFQLPTP